MDYIKTASSPEYPYPLNRLHSDFPQVSFPEIPSDETLAEYGIFPVAATSPDYDEATQRIVEIEPVYVAGAYRQAWQVIDLTQEEIEAKNAVYVTADDFRNRFTEAEMDAILAAAYAGDTICRRLLFKLQTNSSGVNLRGATEIAGINYLTTIGLLTVERAEQILTTN